MGKITVAQVKELREQTDAPMMECKKALIEAAGSLDRAKEVLRVKLGNKADEISSRVSIEGITSIFISQDAQRGAIVEVSCETDFVAKNKEFINFASKVAEIIVANKIDEMRTLSSHQTGSTGTVEAMRVALVGKIGENISIRRFQRIETSNLLTGYVHRNKIAAIVEHTGSQDTGKDLAMHVVATRPKFLNLEAIPDSHIAFEKTLARKKAEELGKPEPIVLKMIEGSIQKFVKESVLLSQPYIKDEKQTIGELLCNRRAAVKSFSLFTVGGGNVA